MAAKNFIRPDLVTLSGLLKDKLFEIPKFQRPYSWKSVQREELFSDIDVLMQDRRKSHFMSTVVCLDTNKKEKDGTDELARMQIVDGQQRLTTLIILLKAIQIELNNSQVDAEMREADPLQKTIVHGKRLILLQTNHQSAQMFREYLVSGIIPDPLIQLTVSERDVACAIKECREYAQKKAQNNELLELLKALKNRLQFIFYTIDDEKVVYTVFEVLNSRGLPVASLDKCKSMLMGVAYEKYSKASERKEIIESLHRTWESIYSAIGTNNIRDYELLRFAATLCYFKSNSISASSYGPSTLGKSLSEDESLNYLEFISKSDVRSADLPASLQNENEDICVLISCVIKQVAEQLSIFAKDVRKNNAVTDITQARLLAVSIGLSAYTQNEKDTLNSLWEKTTFRIYGLYNKDSRSCVGDYVRLARDIYSGMPYTDAFTALNGIGANYPVKTAIAELRGKPWYKDYKDEVKYVLYRYEEALASESGSQISDQAWNEIWSDTPSKTIEHIYPETFNATLQRNWPNKNIDSQEKLEAIVHNIGNLTLLPPGLNSSLGQKAFAEKKIEYARHSLRITDDVVSKTTWTEKDILNREDSILKFIEKEWA